MIYALVAQASAFTVPEARGSTVQGARREVPPSGEFQLVEQPLCKRTVGGSSPSRGPICNTDDSNASSSDG